MAGVQSSDQKAVAWLWEVVEGAKHSYRAAKKRPLAIDHNTLLADVEATAKKLIKQLDRLHRYPATRYAFWRSREFGPVRNNRVEVANILHALEKIIAAAGSARDLRRGRRRASGEQHVVDLAYGFFIRFSPLTPSGTPTGPFAKFAREFHSVATGTDPEDDGGLDRQIRAAQRLSARERERLRQNGGKKSNVSS